MTKSSTILRTSAILLCTFATANCAAPDTHAESSHMEKGRVHQALESSGANLDFKDLQYLKFLYASSDELYLRQAFLPTAPVLRGGLANARHEITSFVWDTNFQTFTNGGIEGNEFSFTGIEETDIAGGFPGHHSHLSDVSDGGADGVAYNGRDWIVWADESSILIRQLSPHGAPAPTSVVRTSESPITTAPTITSHHGELVVAWTEDRHLMFAHSSDGHDWSLEAPSQEEFSFSPFFDLVSFQNQLLLITTLASNHILLASIPEDFSIEGLNTTLYISPSDIVEQSISAATRGDELLSVVFANTDGTQVIHWRETFGPETNVDGPYLLDSNVPLGRPASAYGFVADYVPSTFLHDSVNLYVVVPRSGGFTTLLKRGDDLFSDGALPFGFAPLSGSTRGALYTSAYAHQSTETSLVSAVHSSDPCTRKMKLIWAWSNGIPTDLADYTIFINGEPLSATAAGTISSSSTELGNTLRLIPAHDHRLQVQAVLNDGTMLWSNETQYRFEPCTEPREVSLAVVLTKIESTTIDGEVVDAPEPFLSAEAAERLVFTNQTVTPVAEQFFQLTKGHIAPFGEVFERTNTPLPGHVTDYCNENLDPDGWGHGCLGQVPFSYAVGIGESIPSNFDYYVYFVGGQTDPGDSGGQTIRLSGKDFNTRNVLVHELGHSLGLHHSGVWNCDNQGPLVGSDIFNIPPDTDPAPCTGTTYGPLLPMGGNSAPLNPFSAFDGQLLGYFTKEQVATSDDSAEFVLSAVESASDLGFVELRIPLASDVNTFYSVEYRKDLHTSPATFFRNVPSSTSSTGLLISLHQAGLRDQAASAELLTVKHLVMPGSPFIDPYREVEVHLEEVLNGDLARVRVERTASVAPADIGLDADAWTDSQGAALATNMLNWTHGGSSVVVPGAGYHTLRAPRIDTRDQRTTGTVIELDVFVPTAQTNPYWVGDIQAFVSIPSGGIYNQYLGYQSLTELSRGEWSQVGFAVDNGLRVKLMEPHPDLQISLAINLGSNLAPTLIDHLRFSGNLQHMEGFCGDGIVDDNEDCDDGNRLGGDSCPARCQQAGFDCNEANAIDLGTSGTTTAVPANACLKVASYPGSWIHALQLQLQSNISLEYVWSTCLAEGVGAFTGSWQQQEVRPISDACTTFIQLQGSAQEIATLAWWGNG